MQRHELEAWLGPALSELREDQIERLAEEQKRIADRFPHPDEHAQREACMSAAVQYLLGETTIDDAGRARTEAYWIAECARYAAATIAAMAVDDGMTETEAAKRARVDRMTIRHVRGKDKGADRWGKKGRSQ